MSDELLIENIKALLHLNASNSLVPHGIGNHARDLLDASITSIDRLRAEVASLKEQSSATTLTSAHLINQLAAANGRAERYRAAIQQTLDENGHLADGEVCTLTLLKRALSDLHEADKEKS